LSDKPIARYFNKYTIKRKAQSIKIKDLVDDEELVRRLLIIKRDSKKKARNRYKTAKIN